MFCPICGNPSQNNYCRHCNRTIPPIEPTLNQEIPPKPSYSQVYPKTNPQLEFYQDGSLYGLGLIIASPFIFIYVSSLLGFGFAIIALILGLDARKKRGRIPLFTIIMASIMINVELIFYFLLMLGIYIATNLFS